MCFTPFRQWMLFPQDSSCCHQLIWCRKWFGADGLAVCSLCWVIHLAAHWLGGLSVASPSYYCKSWTKSCKDLIILLSACWFRCLLCWAVTKAALSTRQTDAFPFHMLIFMSGWLWGIVVNYMLWFEANMATLAVGPLFVISVLGLPMPWPTENHFCLEHWVQVPVMLCCST